MASQKKKRKERSIVRRELKAQVAPRPHPDGDRRRRSLGITVREAIARKQAMQSGEIPPPPRDALDQP